MKRNYTQRCVNCSSIIKFVHDMIQEVVSAELLEAINCQYWKMPTKKSNVLKKLIKKQMVRKCWLRLQSKGIIGWNIINCDLIKTSHIKYKEQKKSTVLNEIFDI